MAKYPERGLPDNLEISVTKNGTAGRVVALDPAGNQKGATFEAYGSANFYDAVIEGLKSQVILAPVVTIIVSKQTVFSSLNLKFVRGDFNQDNTSKALTTSAGRSSMDQNTTVLKFDFPQQLDVYTGLDFYLPANESATFTFEIENILHRET